MKPVALLRTNPNARQLATSGEGVIGATQAWSRALFDRFPPLEPHIHCEDSILPFRAALGHGIGYVAEPLLRYRTDGISADFLAQNAREALWGSGLKVHRWLRDGFAQMQRDLDARPDLIVAPGLRDLLARQEARHAAPLDLAGAPYIKRVARAARLMRNANLGWKDRLRPAFMYLAPVLWSLQLEAKRRLGRL